MSSLKNTEYLFVPFIFSKHTDYNTLISVLDNSDCWQQVHDKVVYMLKYVADKIDSNNKATCQCFHYDEPLVWSIKLSSRLCPAGSLREQSPVCSSSQKSGIFN